MNTEAERALGAIARAGLERCAAKLSRLSGAKWEVAGSAVKASTMAEISSAFGQAAEGGAAVFLEAAGEEPFSSMAVFRPEDIEVISRGFLGFSFSKLPVLSQAQELLLSELGNILLNSFLGALSNAVGRSYLPAVPKCVQGEAGFLAEALQATLDAGRPYAAALLTLELACDGLNTKIELIAAVPEGLEKALVAAARGE